MRRLIYQHNYDYWLRKYPGLRDSIALRRMFLKVAFERNEVGKILASRTTIAKIEGVKVTKDYLAYKFLDAYKAIFPGFQYSGYSGRDRICRMVVNDGFDDEDRVRIIEEKLRRLNAPLVHFLSGRAYGRRDHRLRQELREEDQRDISLAQNADARFIQEYINSLHSRGFTDLLPRLAAAREVVSQLRARNPEHTELLRGYQQSLLNEIEEQPQPFVEPSPGGKTLRLMPVNRGISLLAKDARRALTPHWPEWDLRQVQFATCGNTWGVARVEAFLENPKASIWDELADYLGVDRATAKAALKNRGVYPLVYGMPERNVAAGVTWELKRLGYELHNQPGMSYGKLFLTHPLIADMLEARNRMQAQIIAAGGAQDCYGNWIAYDPEEENENSVLAQLAQAIELKLIVPVFRVAKDSKGELTVRLYQFDGVSVTTRRSERARYWFNAAAEAVKEEAQRLGIQTALAVSS